VKRIQPGVDPAAGIDSFREKILHDLGATIETGTRKCLRQPLRFIGKHAAVKPFDDWTRRAIGKSHKQWREPGEVSSHQSSHRLLERNVIFSGHRFRGVGNGLTFNLLSRVISQPNESQDRDFFSFAVIISPSAATNQ
jgi:hypothetical protein